MYKISNQIWIKEEIPKKWTEAITCTLHKKYVRNTAYTIISILITEKLTTEMRNTVGEFQCDLKVAGIQQITYSYLRK